MEKQTAIVRQTEECWLPKIVLSYDFACYFLHVWIGVKPDHCFALLVTNVVET